jgi:hypothetical protein
MWIVAHAAPPEGDRPVYDLRLGVVVQMALQADFAFGFESPEVRVVGRVRVVAHRACPGQGRLMDVLVGRVCAVAAVTQTGLVDDILKDVGGAVLVRRGILIPHVT